MTRASVSFGNDGRSNDGGRAVTTISSCSSKRSLASVGNYRMLRELGKGNFATVYEAVHTVLKIRVAIKIIDTANVVQPYVLKNLTREAKLLAKLQHPSIVCLYETIRCRSSYYLVTELATGGDLYTHIKSQPNGHLDEETAKSYARQLVSALDHMHLQGIVHRDLKMENIMLRDSRKKHIKIIDFGLSNWYSGNQPQTHCGSPEYAAPELFHEDRKYGPEVDLWSLGVILYGMMAGHLPFLSRRSARTPIEEWREKLMKQIFCGLTETQEKKISTTSRDYKDLVRRLLQLQPHRRIPMRQIFRHPWINGKDKHVSDPILHSSKGTSEREIKAIIEEICAATKKDPTTIEKELRDVRCGDIKGMFNIIRHRIRGNGSTDVFGESSIPNRRLQIERYFNQQRISSSTTPAKLSPNRRVQAIKISRSNTVTPITEDKSSVDSSKEPTKFLSPYNPVRSVGAMRDLDSLHAWFRELELKPKKTNRKSIIGRTIESDAVPVSPMTQPHNLRSSLAHQLSSLLSKTSNDSHPRPSCPGSMLITRNTSYTKVERSFDKDNILRRRSISSVSQYCHTGNSLIPEVAKKLQHCSGSHGEMLKTDRRLFRNAASVETTKKRYLEKKKRPQSLEITSETLERAKHYLRPSSSIDRRFT